MSSNSPYDPMAAWRGMSDAALDQWSKAMIEAVNTEEYAKAMGQVLDTYLSASAPFQQAMERTMKAALAAWHLPSREDVTGLAERLTNIEMRLDDLDAKLDTLARQGQNPPPKPAATGRRSGPRGAKAASEGEQPS